jgi:lipopolysaccharide export system permease protein
MNGGLVVLGRLDRYVLRLFALSYLVALLLVVGLFLIIDVSTKLEDFLEPASDGTTPPTALVVHYYVLQTPLLYLQVSPFVAFLAGVFTATRLSKSNEVVAALGAGVSARRLLAPVFASALVLAIGVLALREWTSEGLADRRWALQDRLIERRPEPVCENFWAKDRNGRPLRIAEFRPGRDGSPPEIRGLSVRFRSERGSSTSIQAERAVPIEPWEEGRWRLEGANRLDLGEHEKRLAPIELLPEEVRFTPRDVALDCKGRDRPLELSLRQVRELLRRDPSNAQFRTLFQYGWTFPLAGLVLLAVGLPFALSYERGRVVERFAGGFLLCVVYFGLDLASRTLGMQGQLGPLHAGWLPLLLFGSLGAVLLGSMRS